MRRTGFAFVAAGVFLIVLGAAGRAGADPLPASVKCPAAVAGFKLAAAAATTPGEDPSGTVSCTYGADHQASLTVTYGTPGEGVAIGCVAKDERTDLTVGSDFDPTGALRGNRYGGTIEDPEHPMHIVWETTNASGAAATKAAALDVARQIAPLTRPCDGAAAKPAGGFSASGSTSGPPASTATAQPSSRSGAQTAAGIALIGGGLVVAAGGLLGIRGTTRPALPLDDQIVSGEEAIDVLLRSGLVTKVTRPNGTIGYQTVGDLTQFNKQPQWRVQLSGQHPIDGVQYHDVGALAFEERPDGTFDSATIVVGVEAAPPPPPAAPAQSPPADPGEATSLGDLLARDEIVEGFAAATAVPPPYEPPPSDPGSPPVASKPPVDPTARDRAQAQRDAGAQEAQQQLDSAKHWGWLETGAWAATWLADRSIDGLEKMTGPGGKLVKDVYTVTSKVGQGVGEAAATGDVTKIGKGVLEGGFELGWGRAIDRVQEWNKIPGFRADAPLRPGGAVTQVIRQVVTPGNATRVIPRPADLPSAVRSAFNSWLRDTFVRDPVKGQIGF